MYAPCLSYSNHNLLFKFRTLAIFVQRREMQKYLILKITQARRNEEQWEIKNKSNFIFSNFLGQKLK